ncbi:hypothetical protein [uncultured Friedmanniella sp.]|uniref:hypothetical protein n=1 Tax=uncultured Friedmanniella sp. TaxID=335381 RepID=UPI0035CC05AC
MGQSNSDKHWPRPTTTRHCWIKSRDRLTPPVQGYVLEWRRHSYRYTALVIYLEPAGRIVQEWLPLEQLAPVRPRPTDLPRDSY